MGRLVTTFGVTFEWDDAKERANVAKHGIAFADAASIFAGTVVSRPDRRFAYGELRWISIGATPAAMVVVVVHTRRGLGARLISARRASRKERSIYAAAVQEAFDA